MRSYDVKCNKLYLLPSLCYSEIINCEKSCVYLVICTPISENADKGVYSL